MKAIYRALICAALVAAPVLFAQPINPQQPRKLRSACSPSGVYCYGVPFYLNGDTSQPVSLPWIDGNFIAFAADNSTGPLAQYGTQYVDIGSTVITYASFTSQGRTVTAIASIAYSFGNGLGTLAGTFTHFYSGGCGRAAAGQDGRRNSLAG